MRFAPLPALLWGVFALGTAPAVAQRTDCPHRRDLTQRSELPSGAALRLKADAGSLVVRGVGGVGEARIRGTVCATSADLLEAASVRIERERGALNVETVIPDRYNRFTTDAFVRIDLVVEVPSGTAATVHDGSGSAELSGLGDLEVHDGSGDLYIEEVSGRVEAHDGSGRLEIRRAAGPVQVHDGSGEIIIRDVEGDIRIHDGSGSIDVNGARGDLVVAEDGSGSVAHANVRGRVEVPHRGRSRHR